MPVFCSSQQHRPFSSPHAAGDILFLGADGIGVDRGCGELGMPELFCPPMPPTNPRRLADLNIACSALRTFLHGRAFCPSNAGHAQLASVVRDGFRPSP